MTLEEARTAHEIANGARLKVLDDLGTLQAFLKARIKETFGKELAAIEEAQASLKAVVDEQQAAWHRLQELEAVAKALRMVPGQKVQWLPGAGFLPAQPATVVKSGGMRVKIDAGTQGVKWVNLSTLTLAD